MFYRVNQFVQAFFPHIIPSETQWALEQLSAEAGSLYLKQSLPEQRHALYVTRTILKSKDSLAQPDFQNLISAALLHDCGKSCVSTRLWHRVFVVLMQYLPKSFWSRIEQGHTVFSLPLTIATQHAFWGGDLARKAGLNMEICLLIREHHTPTTDLGRILEQADNIN